MNRINLFSFFLFLFNLLNIYHAIAHNYNGGDNPDNKDTSIAKIMSAKKINQAPKIDGKLEEAVWDNAMVVSGFTTFEPEVGQTPSQKTEIKITYDNSAIYVAARMYDTATDSILRQLGTRDAVRANADYIAIFLDTYDDDQNGFGFVVSAANVQSDAKYSASGEDWTWNGVWYSNVQIEEGVGWTAELKIPYFTIRFPEKEVQDWGIGFMRQIRRHRERSMWNNMDPSQDGFVNQFGSLKGLTGIQPPVRLSVTPYISTYTDFYRDSENPDDNTENFSVRGGMDLKYGINESFTLDMALIPDFGQVQSDDQVLNLGPFEVFFNENRPFFMEGTELFSKGDIFYSRRIGGRPLKYYDVEDELLDGESIENNPTAPQMYNASKISGRNPNGIGLGFFNAVTGRTYATIVNDETGEKREMLTTPLTNYNILVFEKTLKNASFINIVNTNVLREGSFRDANVTAGNFSFSDKKQVYAISGSAKLSQLYAKDEFEDGSELGFAYNLDFAKTQGNFKFNVWQNVESDTYDPNDLGFLNSNNEFTNGLTLRYNIYQPKGIYNNVFARMSIAHSMLYKPFDFQDFRINGNAGMTLKNFMTVGMFYNFRPVKANDYFEPRAEDRFSKRGQFVFMGAFISTDYRKKLAFDIEGGAGTGGFENAPYNEYFFRINPRVRVNDRLSFNHNLFVNKFPDNSGYATTDEDTDNIIYGSRKISTVINTLTGNYIFTSRMGLSLRARHYWSRVNYDQFYQLREDGFLDPTEYTGNHDNSFNAFNVDLVYNWEFTPGSQLSIVWKNNISLYTDSDSEEYSHIATKNYLNNVSDTFNAPQLNSFSIRLLYFLDYQQVFKKKVKAKV